MKTKIYILLIGCLALLSCQNDEAGEMLSAYRRIYLSASVEGTLESRAPFSWLSPSLEHPLEVDVWASTDENSFTHEDGADGLNESYVSLHTSARFTNASEQLLDAAVYPSQNARVYFVGMYPKGWAGKKDETNAVKFATYTFNGKEDVMFAPKISGSYGENTGEPDKPWPTFQFKHLLTWLRFEIKAEDDDVSEAWGKLKGIKIKSPNQVTVDLTKNAYKTVEGNEVFDESVVAFGGNPESLLNLYDANDQVFPGSGGYSLPYQQYDENAAYVLCAPVEAQDEDAETYERLSEYTLLVETEKREVEVQLDLKTAENTYFEGSTRGQQFTIRLLFKMGNSIIVSAHAEEWVNGGIINGDVTE